MLACNELVEKIKSKESKRLGFPVSGGILRGKFTNNSWAPDPNGEPIVDLKELGVLDNKPAGTFLNNVGSPFEEFYVGHDSKLFEKQLIEETANFFSASIENIFGYVTSGGSESNLAALWWHREHLLSFADNAATIKPVLIFSDQSHHSILKCANILSYEQQPISSSKVKGINLKSLEYSLLQNLKNNKKHISICLNLGTTKEGCIDDVIRVKHLCEKMVPDGLIYTIHADAAIYGAILPCIDKFKKLKIFDLVDSISLSGHKFLGSFSICGLVLTKKNIVERKMVCDSTKVSYIDNITDICISCSRSGYAVIELYSILKNLDAFTSAKTRLNTLYTQCKYNAIYLCNQLKEIAGKKYVFRNYLTVVFPMPKKKQAANEILKKFSLMISSSDQFSANIFPQISLSLIDEFIAEYKKVFEYEDSI